MRFVQRCVRVSHYCGHNWLSPLSHRASKLSQATGARLAFILAVVVTLVRFAPGAQSPSIQPTDNSSPKLVRQSGHRRIIQWVAVNPVLPLLASCDGQTVLLWNTSKAQQVRSVLTPFQSPGRIAFSPDGRLIAVANWNSPHGALYVEDLISGEQFSWDAHEADISSLVFTRSGHLATSSFDGLVKIWEVPGHKLLKKFDSKSPVSSMDVSADESMIVTGDTRGAVTLWNTKNEDHPVWNKPGHTGLVMTVAVDPKGRFVASGGLDGRVVFWTLDGVELSANHAHTQAVNSIVFGPASSIFSISTDQTIRTWNRDTFREDGDPWNEPAFAVQFSEKDSALVIVAADDSIVFKDIHSRETLKDMHSPSSFISSVAFSVDGNTLATGSYDTRVRLWELSSDAGPVQSSAHRGSVTSVVFSPNGEFFATGGIDKRIVVTNRHTGDIFTLTNDRRISALLFDQSSKRLLSGDEPEPEDSVRVGAVKVWPLEGRREPTVLGLLPGGVKSLSIDYSGTKVGAGSGSYSPAKIWNLDTGAEMTLNDPIDNIAFSPKKAAFVTTNAEGIGLWHEGDKAPKWKAAGKFSVLAFTPSGRYVAASEGASVTVWNVETGQSVQSFVGHSDLVTAIAFNEQRELAATGSWDGTTRLWRMATEYPDRPKAKDSWICTLVSYAPELWFIDDTPWVVVEPGGHFDTNSPDEMPGLHWIVKARPYDPLPIESFERIFYQPRLLQALLANKPLRSTAGISDLNYEPPVLKIKDVVPHDGEPDLVDVTVDVAAADSTQKNNANRGVYDLRLFIDGQLVAYKPNFDDQSHKSCAGQLSATIGWRCSTLVTSSTRTIPVTFPPIRISPAKYFRDVDISAYAFNEDKVKSVTDHFRYHVDFILGGKHSGPYEANAYLINIGVSRTKGNRWNLVMPGRDARWISTELTKVLVATKYYKDVVPIVLASDDSFDPLTEINPSKANIKAVLDLLAGKPISEQTASQIPVTIRQRIHPANVNDVVIVSFSGHGRTTDSGEFVLFPYDVDVEGVVASVDSCHNCISTEELSDWLKDIFSSNLALILDACRSANSVETEDFRLGPMGDPGLGQLAWDKDIQVLAASQAFQDARGIAELGHSALAYALVQEGLIDKKAADSLGGIELTALLKYGTNEVPKLYSRYLSGETETQQPKLFDFTAKTPGNGRDSLPAVVLMEGTLKLKETEHEAPVPPPDPENVIEPLRSWNLTLAESEQQHCLPQIAENNLVVAVACEKSSSLWVLDISTGAVTELPGVFDEPRFGYRGVRLSPTGTFVVTRNGIAHPALAIWNVKEKRRQLVPLTSVPGEMEFLDNGRRLLILPLASSEHVAIYDFGKRRFQEEFAGLTGPALFYGERLCSQSAYNKARVWDLMSDAFVDFDDTRQCVQFSGDSSVLAALSLSDWDMTQLWQAKDGAKLAKHRLASTRSDYDKSLIILPDNERAIVRDDANQIRIWDFVKDSFSNPLLNVEHSRPDLIGVSRSGKTLAIYTTPGFQSGEGDFVDIQTGKLLAHFQSESSLWGYSPSPDHRLLAVAGTLKPAVKLWNLEDGSVIGVCKDSSRDYTFSPDSTLLVTTSDNGEVRVFRMPTENGKTNEP